MVIQLGMASAFSASVERTSSEKSSDGKHILGDSVGYASGVSAAVERTSSEKPSDAQHIFCDSFGCGERRLGRRAANA